MKQPSRELDALVAEKVMGWRFCQGSQHVIMGLVLGEKTETEFPIEMLVPPEGELIKPIPPLLHRYSGCMGCGGAYAPYTSDKI